MLEQLSHHSIFSRVTHSLQSILNWYFSSLSRHRRSQLSTAAMNLFENVVLDKSHHIYDFPIFEANCVQGRTFRESQRHSLDARQTSLGATPNSQQTPPRLSSDHQSSHRSSHDNVEAPHRRSIESQRHGRNLTFSAEEISRYPLNARPLAIESRMGLHNPTIHRKDCNNHQSVHNHTSTGPNEYVGLT